MSESSDQLGSLGIHHQRESPNTPNRPRVHSILKGGNLGGTLFVQVVGAHHLATFRKDKKAKYGEPYCMVKAAGQTQATTTASFNGSDLEWSDPVMQFKLTSLDDVRLEITLLAADPQKAGREKPKVVGQLAQSYRVLSLPKSGELCKPIWVPIYDVSVGAGESILGSGLKGKAPQIAGELCLMLYCEYGSLGEGLRRTISDSTTASGVADEQDMVYINKALEEKFRNVRIQIWEKKRQRMQSEAQLNKMTAMLGESSEIVEQRQKLSKMRDDITAMEKMIGMTVDQDPRKDTIVNQTAPGQERASAAPSATSAGAGDKHRAHNASSTSLKGAAPPAAQSLGKNAMRCVRAFQSDQPTHMSVTVGELVSLLADAEPGWCICQRGAEKGKVPRECLRPLAEGESTDTKLVPDGYIQIEPDSSATDLLSTSPLSPSSKPKNGFIPFTRRSVRSASQSTAAAGSQSGATSANGSPGLRAQISHLGSSFFGGAQPLAKGDDAVERLAQMVVEVQKTLLETLVWQARADEALDDILAQVAGPQPTSARQARPSLQELPESGARAEIRVFDKPKPKGRKTGISKAMDLLRSDSGSGHDSDGSGDKPPPASPLAAESNTALRLEFALKEKEYIRMITDLQTQLRNKDLAMKQREIELRDELWSALEARMQELAAARPVMAASSPSQAVPSGGAPPPPPPPRDLANYERKAGPGGPPPPPPLPHDLANYEKKTANQKAASEGDKGQEAMALERLMSKLDQLDKLDSILQKLNSLNVNIGVAAAGGGASSGPARTMAAIQQEMSEQMAVIMDQDAGDRAREDANIKYEKLMNELEQNPEYRAQLDEKRREKEARNAPLNQAAMQELRGMFAPDRLDADPDLRRKVQKSPELTLIGLDHRTILSKHENDFKTYTMRGLACRELRAIMGSLPEFKKNQTVQIEWKERLANKIDEAEVAEQKAASAPAAPPKVPASAPKKIAPAKKAGGGKPGDFLAELRARQAAAGGSE